MRPLVLDLFRFVDGEEENADNSQREVIFQGDMIMTIEQVWQLNAIESGEEYLLPRLKRSTDQDMDEEKEPAKKVYNQLWPNCQVPFVYGGFLGKQTFQQNYL